jgi:photosystem II stability/assembly factor-like uncharacterized protein
VGWTQNSPANPVYHLGFTVDGGNTWTDLPSPPPSKDFYGFVLSRPQFRNPGEGWARSNEVGPPAVYSTHDGGVIWKQHLLPVSSDPGQAKFCCTDVSPLPGGGVFAVSGDLAYTSFDGGVTWRDVVRPPAVSYGEIEFEDATHWWAMQRDGELYKTEDGGRSWKRASGHQDGLPYVIGVIDAKHAWARIDSLDPLRRGYGLALTADGGVHWIYANVPTPPHALTYAITARASATI